MIAQTAGGRTTTDHLWLTIAESRAREFQDLQPDNPSSALNRREGHAEQDIPTSPNAIRPKPSKMR